MAALLVIGLVVDLAISKNQSIRSKLIRERHNNRARFRQQKFKLNNKLSKLQDELKENKYILHAINNKIEEEEKAISTFENVTNDSNTKFIVALGNAGYGKSTVLNRLYGDVSKYGNIGPFKAGGGDQSVTEVLEHRKCQINNTNTVLVDTPGYKDTKNRDNLHFNNLGSYLYGCGGVDAFLLVCNGTNVRFDGNFQLMLKEYTKYFGSAFWKHLIVILTRIEYVEKEKFVDENRGQKLQQNLHDMFDSMDDNYKIPIITIGYNDNYQVFCRAVMDKVINISNNNGKLICDNIKSPINDLQTLQQQLKQRQIKLSNRIQPIRNRINVLNAKIAALNHKIVNPESVPLFTNFSATV